MSSNRTDERERRVVDARDAEQAFAVAVGQEVGLPPGVAGHETEMSEPDPSRPVFPIAMRPEEGAGLPAPQRAEIGEHLAAQLGELPERAVVGGMRSRVAGLRLRKPAEIEVQRDEPRIRVPHEGEGGVLGVEIQSLRHPLDAFGQQPPVPPGPEAVAASTMGHEPVEHGGARALGHFDADAAVAVRNHAARPAPTAPGHGGGRPSSPASAGCQPGRTASAWARNSASPASQV